jgi:hypothetical protein
MFVTPRRSELEEGEGPRTGPGGCSEDDWIKTNRIDHEEAGVADQETLLRREERGG